MRAVAQRVARASVHVGPELIGAIEIGLLVLLGVGVDDSPQDAKALAAKIASLRIFNDAAGLMNQSVLDVGGRVLLVSQFTLHGDARKGRRPSFISAAPEDRAKCLYELTGRELALNGLSVSYGRFGATMEVELVNQGPVTILLDTKKQF
ncbi:MAG: D-aminoacyl-tRNA deacylase [Candidatus Eremiobacteraeota bacterium]|nr:D-aminoacyl-tRNA deacylase [Candidatus Eremiobacteraeota bacterium]